MFRKKSPVAVAPAVRWQKQLGLDAGTQLDGSTAQHSTAQHKREREKQLKPHLTHSNAAAPPRQALTSRGPTPRHATRAASGEFSSSSGRNLGRHPMCPRRAPHCRRYPSLLFSSWEECRPPCPANRHTHTFF